MSSLDQAINRLQQSVDKLESSLTASASKNTESEQMQALGRLKITFWSRNSMNQP